MSPEKLFLNKRGGIMARLLLEALGLCEKCGTLLNIEGMPSDSADADWPCPECKTNTTGASFGYQQVDGKWKKVRWVGKVGNKVEWVTKKPTEDFHINGLEVWLEDPAPRSF